MQIETGTILQGKVSGIAPFGAFVELDESTSGLVHISEVSEEYVENVSEHLTVGQEVKVKVLGVDEKGKISLSIKRAAENHRKKKGFRRRQDEPIGKTPPEEFDFSSNKQADMSFEDMLSRFKHDSDEKMQDLKRNTEGKRSGGYRRSY